MSNSSLHGKLIGIGVGHRETTRPCTLQQTSTLSAEALMDRFKHQIGVCRES